MSPAGAPGRFVSLEGVDGSGKSTQAAMLADALERAGRAVVRTREPGGTPLGEALRRALLESAPAAPGAPGGMCAVAEMHLFAAARAQLVADVIAPALREGSWVVADRFVHSSLAYQGAARGLGIAHVLHANEAGVGRYMPSLTLIIELDPATAAGRRCAGPDRIEAEGDDFQRRVAAGYRDVARRFPARVRVVDGGGAPEEVHARVVGEVAALGGAAR